MQYWMEKHVSTVILLLNTLNRDRIDAPVWCIKKHTGKQTASKINTGPTW